MSIDDSSMVKEFAEKPAMPLGNLAFSGIMIGTPAIRNLIREAKIAQMYSSIQTGQALGMQTLDQNLTELIKRNIITKEEARGKAANKDAFN